MRFLHRPVYSFEDATRNFEQLEPLVPATAALAASKNLSDVANRVTALLNLGVARGTVALTWSGAIGSAIATVTHGFATAPTSIGVFDTATGGPTLSLAQPFNIGATTFQTQATFLSGTFTGTKTFSWIAVL